MANIIVDNSIEFLKDQDTGDLVGYKRADGTERGVVTSQTNPLTGGVTLFGLGGQPIDVGTDGDAETVSYSGGIPIYDVGKRFSYNGIQVSKVSNGESFRYIAEAGSRLSPALLNLGRCTDAVTTEQYLAEFTVPGGIAVHNDQLVINFTLACATQFGSTSSSGIVTVEADGNSTANYTWRFSIQSATSTSQTFTLILQPYKSTSLFSGTSNWQVYSNQTTKRLNLLKDFKVRIGFLNAASAAGRVILLDIDGATKPTIEIKPASAANIKIAGARSIVSRPFSDQSFINVPLPSNATYGDTATDPISAAVATSGNNYGGLAASSFTFVQGYNTDAAVAIYQMNNYDPWCDLRYTSKCPGAAWLFPTTGSGANTIKIRLPLSKLPTGQQNDSIILLITPDKRYVIEAGSYNWDGTQHNVSYMLVHDLFGTGMSNRNIRQYSSTNIDVSLATIQEAYRASGISVMAGIVRGADIAAGAIEHMIAMQCSASQQRAGAVAVVGSPAGGTTFVVRPTRSEYTAIDYTPLFPAGTSVVFAGTTYTTTGTPTYDSGTGNTTFTVTVSISGSAAYLTIGGSSGSTAQGALQYAWPATSKDGGSSTMSGNLLSATAYHGVVPMGAVFAIPPAVNLASLGLSPTGLMLATALQKYGAINVDTTVGTFGLCQIDNEFKTNYPSQLQELYADKETIRQQLRRVTNYDRTLVDSASRDPSLLRGAAEPAFY